MTVVEDEFPYILVLSDANVEGTKLGNKLFNPSQLADDETRIMVAMLRNTQDVDYPFDKIVTLYEAAGRMKVKTSTTKGILLGILR